MSNRYTKEQLYHIMSSIHSKDTKPELLVRRFLWNSGFRYRLNHKQLPGKPDIVLRRYKTCVFVNGCFWHGHEGCDSFRMPKTNTDFWQKKIIKNRQRDILVQRKLASMGWHTITIWECELKSQRRDETLRSLVYTLNHIFLENYSVKRYAVLGDAESSMVAEDVNEYC